MEQEQRFLAGRWQVILGIDPNQNSEPIQMLSFGFAEREGFEPPVPLTAHLISNQAHSTTLTPLRERFVCRQSSNVMNGFVFENLFDCFLQKKLNSLKLTLLMCFECRIFYLRNEEIFYLSGDVP